MDAVLAVGIGALQLFGTYMAAQSQPDKRQLDAWPCCCSAGARSR